MRVRDLLKQASLDGNDLQLIILDEIAPGRDKSFLVTNDEQELAKEQLENIEYKIAQRRAGVPLAYILGYKEFYGYRFLVDDRVLVPRPETEVLVDLVAELEPETILEVGTGSGCIAITLALELPKATVIATDISSDALNLARNNADSLSARVDFIGSDLLNAVQMEVDVIVANLPYVDETWDFVDKKQLKYEPARALYADDGGLALIKKLINQVAEHRCAKYLVLEADPCQHAKIIEYAEKKGLGIVKKQDFGLVFALNR